MFGFKVGELRLAYSLDGAAYSGNGVFRTTGLAGALKRVRFTIAGRGRIAKGDFLPQRYRGHIDTGRRQSKTVLSFAKGQPQVEETASQPAVPIAASTLTGASDPFTMMLRAIRDKPGAKSGDSPHTNSPCDFGGTLFDGTRLARIDITKEIHHPNTVTCDGTYTRVGGYTVDELDEMSVSPLSVTFRPDDGMWRAERVRGTTRSGSVTLIRRQ